jgi:hypothetical protein
MQLFKKIFFVMLANILVLQLYAQPNNVNILTYNVKPVLPADLNDWQSIPAAIILVVQAGPQSNGMIKPVFTIKQGGGKVCGNTVGTANAISIAPTHNFTTAEVVASLTTCPKLKAGNYTLCVQFFNQENRELSKEVCKEFRVEDVVQNNFCNPPQNINPTDGKIFTEKDFLIPKTFTWSPFITNIKTLITYKLTVWEIEEGQGEAQAMYDNFPVLQEDVKGITRYTSKPSTWERRNATYVWRVEALDQEGKPICKTNISAPTQFKVVLKEEEQPADSTTNETSECCKDSIKNVSKTIAVVGTNLNIVQNFTLSPNNITKINAEIFFVSESNSDTSCRKCITSEAAVWNFVPMNKVIWNSGLPNNGSPNNASGTYPAQNIVWFCNAQGNLKLDLKIALPGLTSSTCKRIGKIGIKFKFTDANCKTCEQTITYDYTIN